MLYAEIRREAESKTASLKTISVIISKDMGMIAKILQLVNSAYLDVHASYIAERVWKVSQ